MSTDQQSTANTDPATHEYRASVVLASQGKGDGEETRYSMFTASQVTPDGAFLASSLLLELGEEVTLELTLGSDKVRANARVVALDSGELSGMRVEFANMSASDRQLIQDQTAGSDRA